MEIGPLKLVERVEQCGTRFTVSGPLPSGYWYIHDFPAADGTLANGADDFIAGAFPACEAVCVYGVINATCMEMWYDPSCTSSGAIEADGTVLALCLSSAHDAAATPTAPLTFTTRTSLSPPAV